MYLDRSPLARFARHLPFAVDDYDAARDAFACWRASGARADRRTVEVWAYGYALDYLTSQFARERTGTPSDFDVAMSQAVGKLERVFELVDDPATFPQYLSVMCKNVLLSHRGRRRETVPVEPWTVAEPAAQGRRHDAAVLRQLLTRAVEALPPALRQVARLRLLGREAYDEISRTTGRPIDSVRTYVSKSLVRLRSDPGLRAVVDEGWLDG